MGIGIYTGATRIPRTTRLVQVLQGMTKARRNALLILALLCPAFVTFFWKGSVVVLQAINSLQNFNYAKPWLTGFVGFSNFNRAFNDPLFWDSISNATIWTIASVIPQATLGMAMALLLNQQLPLRGLIRTLALTPWAISAVAGALMWAWMMNGSFGVINDMALRVGIIDERIAWLSDPDTAMGGVVIANIWRGTPFFAVAFLSALQSIPDDLYEAAEIDGAGMWHSFLHITLPMLSGVIAVTILVRSIWTFNWVETIFAMTAGGPADSTMTLPMYIFHQFFRFSDVGYASALAMLLFFSLLLFAIAYIRLTKLSEAAGR